MIKLTIDKKDKRAVLDGRIQPGQINPLIPGGNKKVTHT